MRRKTLAILVGLAMPLLAGLVLFPLGVLPTSASSAPDVIVESITLEPSSPGVGQMFTLTIVTRNLGDVSTGNFWDYVYLNPADRPPNESTAHTFRYNNLPMGPGEDLIYTRSQDPNLSFSTASCDHVIYAWADKTDLLAESVETNNVLSRTVCVGVTCEADAYEEDDACADAGWITNTVGIPQHHTLCPDGDQDWFKFTAMAEVTYTIEATNLGAHADPLLYLYDTCDDSARFGTGAAIEWYASASGVRYLQVKHPQETHGPLADYDLAISVAGSSEDLYEPDDTCAMARDIPTDGTRQTHLFQDAGDEDWVKFSAHSGETVAIVADKPGAGVKPLLSLYDSCEQGVGDPADQEDQIETKAATESTYYVKIVNQDPSTYGPAANYDLSVTTLACEGDSFEEDDSALTARELVSGGEPQRHSVCPASDVDWVRFTAQAGGIYVLETWNLGSAADTRLSLYDTDGSSELVENDDWGYGVASRIIWEAPQDGTYYATVRHHDAEVSGPDTGYDLSLSTGRCLPDTYEADNGPAHARPIAGDGQVQSHSFCADPLASDASDQDWVKFEAVAGPPYLILTSDLGPDCDTVLHLYDRDASTLLAYNDDTGPGRASAISTTLPASGTYYVQVTQYNTSLFGAQTSYQLSVSVDATPSPPPTPTPPPPPPPTPTPPPPPSEVETLIVVNGERMAALHGEADAKAVMDKLYELADHSRVQGAVIQVEDDEAVAKAYEAWTADLLSSEKANQVSSAVRNLVMTFVHDNANVHYLVLVGDDRVLPFRREPEGNLKEQEHEYADNVTPGSTQWAALRDNMILTDGYYGDREPTKWKGRELYIADYAVGRLVEEPGEITTSIDAFLADDILEIDKGLVSAYDLAMDCGDLIGDLFRNDNIPTDDSLIGPSWTGDDLRARMLQADPRFDVQSVNGHSTHASLGTPDPLDSIEAAEVAAASGDLSGVLVYSIGCHAGLNDTGSLDLAQAFAQKGANFVGNTGYGWGGNGIVWSEALMKDYSRRLLQGSSARIGQALAEAQALHYARARHFDDYDAKVLMQATLYGLPMYENTSGEVLDPDDPFPSAHITSTVPFALGNVAVGHLAYGLAGAFGENTTEDGTYVDLDDWIGFSAGAPIQPRFFADVAAPAAGSLHGAILVGGVYRDVPSFDPVIALAYNEYVTSTEEPTFSAPGWFPAVPFSTQAGESISTTAEMVVSLLGQYHSESGTERLYEQIAFDTYYAESLDREPPRISHVDGILAETLITGTVKVEAADPSGILRVVVAYTAGQGKWQSQDLVYDAYTSKWTGILSGTVETQYLVQVVDGAGNVAIDHNKGRYRRFSRPVPLIEDAGYAVYLPLVVRGG
jgi:hypothetical protein